MPQILLVSATAQEIAPTLQFLEDYGDSHEHNYTYKKLGIKVCITGVGMVNTAFELGKLRGKHFDLAINAGIAGSFTGFSPGEVVNVRQDCFSELGAEDGDKFIRVDDLGFGNQMMEIANPYRSDLIDKLPTASGITVSKVHGNEESIKKILSSHRPGVETMEGAAFIHAANAFEWKALQLRGISNKVERRNKENWDIPLAIRNVNIVIIEVLKTLNENPKTNSKT